MRELLNRLHCSTGHGGPHTHNPSNLWPLPTRRFGTLRHIFHRRISSILLYRIRSHTAPRAGHITPGADLSAHDRCAIQLLGDARQGAQRRSCRRRIAGQKIPTPAHRRVRARTTRDLDAGLTAQERALHRRAVDAGRAHVFVILCQRWVDDHGWRVVGPGLRR